jgi:plasmid stability protein
MAAVTIRKLPDEVHRALKARTAQNHRSMEDEICAILEAAVRPPDRLLMGTVLANLSRKFGLTNADVEALEDVRDKTPAEPLRF